MSRADVEQRPIVVQLVEIVSAHGFRFADRLLDRLMPSRVLAEAKKRLELVDWEKLVLITPTPKRLEILALVLRGAIMMNRRSLDSDRAWEQLEFPERAPWIHIAATLWSTTFRIALEARDEQQRTNGKEEPRAQDTKATTDRASEAAPG